MIPEEREKEEAKLKQQAIGFRGTNAQPQLVRQAEADGFTAAEALSIVDDVLNAPSETGKNGGAFGTAHAAGDRYKAIKARINAICGQG